MTRREAILGGVLALGGAGAGLARLRPGTALGIDPALAIPAEIGPWQAQLPRDAILPEEDRVSARVYDDLVVRSYVRDGWPPITMVLAYGERQDYAFQVHRPEICYPAAGFALLETARTNVRFGESRVPANVLRARRGRRAESALYWTRIGAAFPQDLWEQRRAVLRGTDRWRIDEGALFRLSLPLADLGEATRMLRVFVDTLAESGSAGTRRILIGSR